MATVDTDLKVIVSKSGETFPYRLESKRKWNVGKRKHSMELTGNVEVVFGDSYAVFPNFDEAKKAVDKMTTKNNGKKAPRSVEHDEQAIRELDIFAHDTSSLYDKRIAIVTAMMKKLRAGKYDHSKAPKAWLNWYTEAAKLYAKEYASPSDWNKIFNMDTRKEAAHHQAAEEYRKMINGEYDYLFENKKAPRKSVTLLKSNPSPEKYHIFTTEKTRVYFWTGKNFDDNRSKAVSFNRETAKAIRDAFKSTHKARKFGIVGKDDAV